ncbi:protein O-glucosyltransferase 2-like [Sycon ciliatum]|uniref:protein O-glucosyltransferase 2-like n=1 Tax=Sycon ciliatum TaxID=27933 RepID=UPI0031F712BD
MLFLFSFLSVMLLIALFRMLSLRSGRCFRRKVANGETLLLLASVLAVCRFVPVETVQPEENVEPADTPASESIIISPQSHMWGPGLTSARSNTPVRYFFVHAVQQTTGENFTASPGAKSIFVDFLDGTDTHTGVHYEVFDRRDGSLAVRYRLYRSYKQLRIVVRNVENEWIGSSPYILDSVESENCFCPAPLDAFKMSFRCPLEGYEQIKVDLSRFGDVNLTQTIPETISRFSDARGACFAHYSIINNKLYAKVHGPHTGFRMFSDAFLSSLVRKVKLADVEFIVNLGDYPQEKRLHSADKLPVFSWCGSTEYADIVMPTYDVTQATVDSMSRVHVDMISSQSRLETGDWERKLPKAFWRGRDSRQERLDLVRLAKQQPDLLDAGLTNFFFFREQEEELGRVPYVSFQEFFNHKYQINLDGTVAAYRFPWLLAGGSAVLKQDSPYYEHFYKHLEAWTHYVPVKRDLSDLLKQIQWLKENEEKAKEIARNGVQFTRDHLMPESIYCYYALLFQQYADKLRTPATVRDGMVEVEQPKSTCDCNENSSPRDEL